MSWLGRDEVVSACGDAKAYIWTPVSSRMAPLDVRTAFQATCNAARDASATAANPAANPTGAGAHHCGNLPLSPASELQTPGTKPGQQKFVDVGENTIMAYVWDAASGIWESIGQVVASPTGHRDRDRDRDRDRP